VRTPAGLKKKILSLDELSGGGLWLVGGFVRDALLRRPTADVDVAVAGDARALAEKFARAEKRRAFALDEERGTYRVVVEDDGQKMDFDFSRLQGKTIEEDLGRRDFTANAMALTVADWAAGRWARTIDPFDGRRALQKKEIALVSPRALDEDPLRLLRAFRFSAELGWAVAPGAFKEIKKRAKKILRSSPERIREELMKTLAAPVGSRAFFDLDKAGLLTVLFPEGEPMRRTGKTYYGAGGVLRHSLESMASMEDVLGRLPTYFPKFHRALAAYLNERLGGHPRYAHLKLVELFHDVGKPATAKVRDGKLHFYGHDAVGAKMVKRIAERLRFSTNEGRSLTRLVGAHMRPGNLGHAPQLTERAIFRFYRDLQEDAVAMLIVALGDHFTYLSERVKRGGKDPVFLTIRKMLEAFFLKRATVEPPRVLDGNVLMKTLGIKPGPEVGRLLDAIREAQAAGQVADRDDALALARRLHAAAPKAKKIGGSHA
jgi:putative nucleotidyltransferase with HDIG domain